MSLKTSKETSALSQFFLAIHKSLRQSVWVREFNNPATDELNKVIIPDASSATDTEEENSFREAMKKSKAKK